MADGYDPDGDDGFGFEDNWLYVEDEFALADELAETQVAEPGYPGTNYEIEMETYEYEMYEFWDDMEYADDEYWDYGVRPVKKQESGHDTQKRKRNVQQLKAHPDKRRKLEDRQASIRKTETDGHYPVCYMSMQEQLHLGKKRPPVLRASKPVAFLPDWRDRFPMRVDMMIVEMPEDMQKAAEAEDDDANLEVGEAEMQESGNEDQHEEGIDAGQDVDGLATLDTETLKTVLRQKMTEAGMEGVGEEELMSTIAQMLNGGADPDEAAGDLASALLGQATQDGGTAFTGWLSQQGVSLEDGEDDATSIAAEDLEQAAAQTRNGQDSSAVDATSSVLEAQAPDVGRSKRSVKKVEVSIPPSADSNQGKSVNGSSLPPPTPAGRMQASDRRSDIVQETSRPPATRSTRKRKAPANEPGEGETNGIEPRTYKQPATKRTRSSKAR